ncbi:MAG: family 78 glycoside hydrolase catalytic domain [Clostridia bacterium]|nr:family 78 glycoside hydrolase catalytic domain [Clostridia bacterium]
MLNKEMFVRATEEYNTLEKSVPAYYFRRVLVLREVLPVRIRVAACGLYELYLNGERITRGFLSPYISNTDDLIYYDDYEVALNAGENVLGLLLGNGLQNNPGGYIWEFDRAAFRGAPMLAVTVTHGEELLFHSGEGLKVAPSPIRSDDYRFGEYYDAGEEIEGWSLVGFDDSGWADALPATPPRGELCPADIDPITKEEERVPIAILPAADGGYIYDFGVSDAGICRLTVEGKRGQRIELRHADSLKDGDLDLAQVWFTRENWERDRQLVHRDVYVCKGVGTEAYEPTFTYHGFRYVKVNGITAAQATEGLLTYLVYHTALATRGGFSCSDAVASTLQEMTRRSILSNFYHFPTDCPQREKNGWTADAALSCEAALLNFAPERNYREWMRNICRAQRADGALPGIVPTGGWGFKWGNGPAWDAVLAEFPYRTYVYRGETAMITEAAPALLAYLSYLRSRTDARGLLSIGLGDWCQVGGGSPKAPLLLTDTVMAKDIADKAAVMLDAVGRFTDAAYARGEAAHYREAIRAHLIDYRTMEALGSCQTSQAMCLFYGVFEREEEERAFARLLAMIHAADDHMDVGVLGGRVLFHVLSRFGHSDLAFRMITRPDYPSYGNWIKRGATTLWEVFLPDSVSSMNHHFWGDISAWFISCLVGIRLNPNRDNVNTLRIAPAFVEALDHASGYHIAPAGRIAVSWEREGEAVLLTAEIPEEITATAVLPASFCFEDGTHTGRIKSGSYSLLRHPNAD